jgi:hypothetical protein
MASARIGPPDEAAQAGRQLARIAPQFRLGSLRKIRFADAARLQSDLELLGEAQIPE